MPECLIVTAVQQELGALGGAGGIVGSVETLDIGPYSCRLFRTGNAGILALAGGIGPAAAASATASILALRPGIELVVSAGIGGGFEAGSVNIGDVVLATSIHFADLGAHSPERFLDAHALGWGHANVEALPRAIAFFHSRLKRPEACPSHPLRPDCHRGGGDGDRRTRAGIVPTLRRAV